MWKKITIIVIALYLLAFIANGVLVRYPQIEVSTKFKLPLNALLGMKARGKHSHHNWMGDGDTLISFTLTDTAVTALRNHTEDDERWEELPIVGEQMLRLLSDYLKEEWYVDARIEPEALVALRKRTDGFWLVFNDNNKDGAYFGGWTANFTVLVFLPDVKELYYFEYDS